MAPKDALLPQEETPLDDSELTSAMEILQRLLPEEELNQMQSRGPAAVYTALVTLWMLILQRLGGGQSLDGVVKHVLAHNRDLLPDNKRVREGTISENSGAYSAARKWLKLETVSEGPRDTSRTSRRRPT